MKASTRRISSLIAVVVGFLLLPGTASAVVYCVPDDTIDPSCDTGQGQATIQDALTAAQASTGVADTVHVDAGSFSEAGLTYTTATSTNVLMLVGEGTAQTLLTVPSTTGNVTGLSITAPAGSTVSNLAMTIPANADSNTDRGMDLSGATLGRNLLVDGPSASNDTGIRLFGSAGLQNSTVNLPFATVDNESVLNISTNSTLQNLTVHGDVGFNSIGTGDTLTIEQSTIQAATAGTTNDIGTIVIRNSLIDLGSNAGAVGVHPVNLNNGTNPMAAVVDDVTIVGGGSNSAGIQVQADSDATLPVDANDITNDGESSTATVSNTVISGPTHSLLVQADRGEVATLTTSYSNYNSNTELVTNDLTPGGGTGTVNFTESNQTNLAPGFVGGSDFHLAAGSPLIDIGDPAAPPGGAVDFDGDPRAVDGIFDCAATARRDIGFDEFVPVPAVGVKDCVPPDTTVTGKTKVKTRKKKARVSWILGSTEPGSTFECSLDGAPFAPCTSPFTAKLRRGKHTLAVRATDAAGNQDQSAASFTTKVKRKR